MIELAESLDEIAAGKKVGDDSAAHLAESLREIEENIGGDI